MAQFPTLSKSLLGSINGWMNAAAPKKDETTNFNDDAIGAEARAIFDYKAQALTLAKEIAGDRKPNMTDYFRAALQIGKQYALGKHEWNEKIFSDLSGQTIDGFQVNQADIQPTTEARMLATIRATEKAKAEGREVTIADILAEVQQINQSGEKPPSVESMKDMLDLDQDQAISDFYANIDRHAKYEKTVFANVSFKPAGTCMRDGENGVALTEGASFENVIFDGMGKNDELTLKNGNYKNIQLTNIKGGQIHVADGTQIDGMDVRGMHAELHIGRASITNLDASDARIVKITAKPGAEIIDAKFNGATIEMGSELEGSKWKNAEFKKANLVDVNMSGTELRHVRIEDCDIKGLNLSSAKLYNVSLTIKDEKEKVRLLEDENRPGLNLSGARLENLTINGVLVTNENIREVFKENNIAFDERTIVTTTPDFLLERQHQQQREQEKQRQIQEQQQLEQQQRQEQQQERQTQQQLQGEQQAQQIQQLQREQQDKQQQEQQQREQEEKQREKTAYRSPLQQLAEAEKERLWTIGKTLSEAEQTVLDLKKGGTQAQIAQADQPQPEQPPEQKTASTKTRSTIQLDDSLGRDDGSSILGNLSPNTAIAMMARTVPPEQQAHAGNMDRSGPGGSSDA